MTSEPNTAAQTAEQLELAKRIELAADLLGADRAANPADDLEAVYLAEVAMGAIPAGALNSAAESLTPTGDPAAEQAETRR